MHYTPLSFTDLEIYFTGLFSPSDNNWAGSARQFGPFSKRQEWPLYVREGQKAGSRGVKDLTGYQVLLGLAFERFGPPLRGRAFACRSDIRVWYNIRSFAGGEVLRGIKIRFSNNTLASASLEALSTITLRF